MLYTNRLLIFTITGIVLGITVGLINNYFWETTELQKYYWGFLGDVIMMNMLKCIIVPLIIFSITTGIASMAENSSQLSVYAIAYYLTTTVIAIILGIVMSLIIKPGSRISSADQTALESLYNNETREGNSVADGLLDIIRNTVSTKLKTKSENIFFKVFFRFFHFLPYFPEKHHRKYIF